MNSLAKTSCLYLRLYPPILCSLFPSFGLSSSDGKIYFMTHKRHGETRDIEMIELTSKTPWFHCDFYYKK
ncbi:hypothetical protein PUN28_013299 [Cardiocondyla obscurior]|uniref:Secreted protein n=1 Tax=Cardiocondyla obscurior TaxID=286306 RepID=A0AAW2FBS1_9HYME